MPCYTKVLAGSSIGYSALSQVANKKWYAQATEGTWYIQKNKKS